MSLRHATSIISHSIEFMRTIETSIATIDFHKGRYRK